MVQRTVMMMAVTSVLFLPVKPVQAEPAQRQSSRPNVLMICIDDLNDWVGCLGGHPDACTPNIDRLAARGILFTNAHCQAPICNPSRTSFMLGLRPSTTGIYMNRPWFRATPRNKNRVTLTQHFASQGYRTFTTGKIYHGSRLDAKSFQVVGPRPGQKSPLDRRIQTELSGLWDFGAQTYDEAKFNDYVDASWAIEQLAQTHDSPFFLTAVSFIVSLWARVIGKGINSSVSLVA